MVYLILSDFSKNCLSKSKRKSLEFFDKMASFFGAEQREKMERSLLSYPAIDSLLTTLEKKTQVKKIYLLYGEYQMSIFGHFSV